MNDEFNYRKIDNYNIYDAVIDKEYKLITAFIKKFGEGIVNDKDEDELTPLFFAAENNDLVAAELLLQAGASVNAVNEFGISIVQQVMRDGNIELLNLFRKYSDSNEWKVNEIGDVRKASLAACTDFEKVDFNAIDIEQISFEPLTIAQKFCTTMIRLKNGDLYSIDGVDAKELRMYLLQKKFGPEYAEQHANINVLSAHVSPGHAFLRLDSEAKGAVYHESRGFSAFEAINEQGVAPTTGTTVPIEVPLGSAKPFVGKPAEPLFDLKAIIESMSHYGSPEIRASATELLQSSGYDKWFAGEGGEELQNKIGEILGYAETYGSTAALSTSANIILKTGEFGEWYAKKLNKIDEGLKEELGAILGYAVKYGPANIQASASLLLKSEELGTWYSSKQLSSIDESLKNELATVFDYVGTYGPPALSMSAQVLFKKPEFSAWSSQGNIERIDEGLKEKISTILSYAVKYGPPILSTSADALLASTKFGAWYGSKQISLIDEGLKNDLEATLVYAATYGSDILSTPAKELLESGQFARMTTTIDHDIGRFSVKQLPVIARTLIEKTTPLVETVIGGAKTLKDFTVASIEGDTETKNKIKAATWEEYPNFAKFVDYASIIRPTKGVLNEESQYELKSRDENHLKIMFLLDDDQAKAALSQIQEVEESCSHEGYVYKLLENNCVDFVQKVYDKIGLEGNIHDYFTDEEMGYGHVRNLDPSEVFENKAKAYGYFQSRGMDHYLDTTFDITKNLEILGIAGGTQEPTITQEIPQTTSFQVKTKTPELPCYYTSGETNIMDMTGNLPPGALLTKCKLPEYKPPFQKSEINIVGPFLESTFHSATISGVSTLTIDVAKELNIPEEYIKITERTVSILTTIYNSQSVFPTLGSETIFSALKSYGYSDGAALMASRVTSFTIRAAQSYANPLGFAVNVVGQTIGSVGGTIVAKGVFHGTKLLGRVATATAGYIVPQAIQDTISGTKTGLFNRTVEVAQYTKDLFDQTYRSVQATIGSWNIFRPK